VVAKPSTRSSVSDSTIVFLVLAGVIVLFASNLVPVDVVAVGTALTLWATDVLTLDQALAGFGDPTVVFIAALFIVSDALDSTGITAWAGQQLIDQAGDSRRRLLLLMMLLCAGLTAFISVNGAVAALLPVVVVIAVKVRIPSSQLLMPLAFSAHAGSMLAMTGTPVNVIVSEAAADAGGGDYGYFEFALAGMPLLIGTVLIIVLIGSRVLPDRNARVMPRDFSDHARLLIGHYELDDRPDGLISRGSGVAEVVIPPRSGMIGETAFPGMVTDSGDLIVLAIHRKGENLTGRSVLHAGDALLLQGTWEALAVNLDDPDVVVVDQPEAVRRQALPLGPGARRTLAVLVGMIVLLATGGVPPAVAGLLAAGAIILLRVLTVEQSYRAISWTTVVLVAGMIPLSTAMRVSGAADDLAELLVDVVGDAGAYPLLIGLFVLTAVLGQLISNTATALIMIPIAVSAATDLDVSVRPVLMSLAVASTAALLTPVATPANMMVMGPGDYRFDDYAKLGLPLLAWWFVVSVGIVPLIWEL
jgi:di/tricarboxylate transporter